MKVQLVQNLEDVAVIPANKEEPIVTKDGAKMVTISIVGTSPLAAILGCFAATIAAIDVHCADKTLYIYPCNLVTSITEHRFSIIVGITGITDLETRIKQLPANLLSPVTPEMVDAAAKAIPDAPIKVLPLVATEEV
jgi:hypothetical protein